MNRRDVLSAGGLVLTGSLMYDHSCSSTGYGAGGYGHGSYGE